MSRRRWIVTSLAAIGGTTFAPMLVGAAMTEIKVPQDVPEQAFDFGTTGIGNWTVVQGQWVVEDAPGTGAGKKALVQRANKNEFSTITA